MKIAILGGAGKMGSIATRFIAEDPRVDEAVILDKNIENAKAVVEYLNCTKVKIREVDIKDSENLVQALYGSDACLNATVFYNNLAVMEACLKAHVHYTDMGGLFHTTLKQLELSDRFIDEGISAVICMGSAPGVPNVQARYAADRLDSIESVKIYDGIKPPPPSDQRFSYAVSTIIDEMTSPPIVFRNGEFISCEPLSDFEYYWFTPPLGVLPMHLSLHSEPATIPITFKEKGIKECFFKINYWGMSKETVEKIQILSELGFLANEPIDINGKNIIPRELTVTLLSPNVASVLDYIAPPVNRPPNWTKEIVTEVVGTKDGKTVKFRIGTLTCKGALPTGYAPAIASIWLAENRIPPGVYPPEAVIDPILFFKELEAKEVVTKVSITTDI